MPTPRIRFPYLHRLVVAEERLVMNHPSEKQDSSEQLSRDDVLILAQHVAMLAASGLPLGPGLRATAEELERGKLRSTVSSLADAIDRGEPLDQAMLAQGENLPRHLQGIVLAGVRSGKLSHVLGRFVMLTNVGVEIRRKLWVSLLYPVMAMTIALCIMVFVFAYLVTSFTTIFRDFGVDLPGLTLLIIATSNFFVQQMPALVMAFVTVIVLYIAARIFLTTSVRRGLATHIPLLGKVWKSTAIAEFCHLLALLLECEIPLNVALGLTGVGVQNREIESACEGLKVEVEKGIPFSDAIKEFRIFPKGIARILKWAESHQGLPESLHMTGDILEARASVQATLAGSVFTILSVILIVFSVGTMVIALFLPLIRLISVLSG